MAMPRSRTDWSSSEPIALEPMRSTAAASLRRSVALACTVKPASGSVRPVRVVADAGLTLVEVRP